MDQKKKSIRNDWIKCQSKSRPGSQYLFNKNTGETKWCTPHVESKILNKTNSPQKTDGNQKSKLNETLPYKESTMQLRTPAQDRLKRLQTKLKSDQRKPKEKPKLERNNNKRNAENKNSAIVPPKRKKEPIEIAEIENPPTTSTNALVKSITSPKGKGKDKKQLPPIVIKKKTPIKQPRTTKKRALNLVMDTPEVHIKMIERNELAIPKATERPLEVRESTISSSWSYGSGFVNKITEICKNTLKSATKAIEERTRLVGRSSTTIPKQDNASRTEAGASTSKMNEATKSVKSEVVQFTPNKMNIPTYDRGNANMRLERLRQSLRLQQNSSENVMNSRRPQNNLSANVFDEPMDWQPIDESTTSDNNKFTKSDNIDMLTLYTNKALMRNTVPPCLVPASSSLTEFHDTVSENLMRLSAVKQRPVKWMDNHYYFVIDTNVLLQQLTFVDDLSKMKLCDTLGSIIYVPYVVLQELDKLKQRAYGEGTKTLAARAIKYLNQQFEANNEHFQAQSASEECKHLIDVESPDDSIINCCLQVYKHVPQLMILLSEDINLRTKAHCNDLLVSTKAELVSRQPGTVTSNIITISTTTATFTSNNIPANE